MTRTVGLTVVAVLALMQGVCGILRAFACFRIGLALRRQGILIVPLIRVVALTSSE